MEFIVFITTPPLQGVLGTIPSKIERKEISAEDFDDAIAQVHLQYVAQYVGTTVEVFEQGSGRAIVKTTTWSEA